MENSKYNISSRLLSVAEVEEKNVEWTISDLLPKGQITILAGDGGSGKSTVACGIIAAVTLGTDTIMDMGRESIANRPPQNVIILNSEDSMECVLKKKLRAAKADLNRVFYLSPREKLFPKCKFGSEELKELIAEYRPGLVVFDPIQSFIPERLNMTKRNDMRACLDPLVGLGLEFGTTFLIVMHTNKRQGVYGRNRIADSADVWDIARSVIIVGHTGEKNMRYFSQEKSNYSAIRNTMLFTISENRAVFECYTEKHDADFIRTRDYKTHQKPQLNEAKSFIIDFLSNGRKLTAELNSAAEAAGISKATFSRAKTGLRQENILSFTNEGYGPNKKFYSSIVREEP